jgi:hypothetical protein
MSSSRPFESLPAGFVERWTKDAKGSVFYGIPVTELTKEELLAGFMWACHDAAVIRKQSADDRRALG